MPYSALEFGNPAYDKAPEVRYCEHCETSSFDEDLTEDSGELLCAKCLEEKEKLEN